MMKNNDDFLIVGAGLYGVTIARHLTNNGHKCLVIDKRFHLGGNVYDTPITIEKDNASYTMTRHDYGPHVFHTSNSLVIDFVTKYANFNNFRLNVLAIDDDNKLYHMPFNRNTLYDIFGIYDIDKILNIIEDEINSYDFVNGKESPINLEEQAISLVGKTIYEKLIKNYTEKQWNTSCKNLSPDIIKRLPFRLYFDNNYFDDTFQGIPIGGYTKMVANMLDGIEVRLNTDYLAHKSQLDALAKKVVYTGAIDAYFDFRLGALEYRSVRFETELLDIPNFQGNAAVNYTDRETPWTRIIEHKWFEFGKDENGNEIPKTVISREYFSEWKTGDEPYYPVNDEKNGKLYAKYHELAEKEENVLFGERLGEYKYYDMDAVIAAALEASRKELS